jgi:3-oxoacyl-[acyl-carrier protein] reductase
VCLVTGASRGIGAAIARAFGREGAVVAVNYHASAHAAERVVADVTAAGGHARAIRADVRDREAVGAMVDDVLRAFGRIDVLVNNAGILTRAPLATMTDETWDQTMDSNVRSVFLVTRAVLPHMLERGTGKIINISSQLGQKGLAGHVHYAAAKAAIIGFTRALAREVGPRGVHVNGIAPGVVETDLIGPVTDELRQARTAPMALGRMGVPDDVAPTAVFLASDDSSYYAGQTLCPNGGDLMT